MEVLSPKPRKERNVKKDIECSRCNCIKERPLAYTLKGKPYYRSWCVDCEKLRKDAWRAENKEHHNAKSRAWNAENPEKKRATTARSRAKHPNQGAIARQRWKEENIDLVRAQVSARRKRVQRATPKLSPEDRAQIKAIYVEARKTGMQVDHIIPLRGKLVSGLHCPANLQLLSPEENMKKSNSFTNADR